MGTFSLSQLVYFAKQDTHSAIMILKESTHESKYFPFCATSINFTAFVIDLIKENRLYISMFKKISSMITSKDVEEDSLVEFCLDVVNEVYVEAYELFIRLWIRKAVNIMSFPIIFEQLKMAMRLKYPTIDEA